MVAIIIEMQSNPIGTLCIIEFGHNIGARQVGVNITAIALSKIIMGTARIHDLGLF